MAQQLVDDNTVSLFVDNLFQVCFVDDVGNFTICLPNGTVVLTSSLNPSPLGISVAFTATVSGAGATPTGTVTFTDGSSLIGTVTLTAGVAVQSTSLLSLGTHTITATYNGDTNYAANAISISQLVTSPLTAGFFHGKSKVR